MSGSVEAVSCRPSSPLLMLLLAITYSLPLNDDNGLYFRWQYVYFPWQNCY